MSHAPAAAPVMQRLAALCLAVWLAVTTPDPPALHTCAMHGMAGDAAMMAGMATPAMAAGAMAMPAAGAAATAPAGSAVGKFLPNIPKWRASFVGTYRPSGALGGRAAVTLAGRYSTKLFTTLDDADVNPNVYGGFGEWFVLDAHASYRLTRHWTGTAGVDNLLDRKYFLFHPFPQRSLVASVGHGF